MMLPSAPPATRASPLRSPGKRDLNAQVISRLAIARERRASVPGREAKKSWNMPKLTPVLKVNIRLKKEVTSITLGGSITLVRMIHLVTWSPAVAPAARKNGESVCKPVCRQRLPKISLGNVVPIHFFTPYLPAIVVSNLQSIWPMPFDASGRLIES